MNYLRIALARNLRDPEWRSRWLDNSKKLKEQDAELERKAPRCTCPANGTNPDCSACLPF